MPTAAAILVFALIGPPVGFVVAFAGTSFAPVLLLGIPMSYLFAPLAAAAGLLYVFLGLVYVKVFSRPTIEFMASCFIGGISGYLSIEIVWAMFAIQTAPPSDFGRLVSASSSSGAICGAILPLLRQSRDSSRDTALTLQKLHRSAMLEADGTMKGAHGRCPDCRAVIQLSSAACPVCDARFDEMATWEVKVLDANEVAACNLALAGADPSERLVGPL